MLIKNSFFKKGLDLLIPLRCVSCGSLLDQEEGLCPDCWPLIPFISNPYCACCGLPFDFEIEPGASCGACSAERPPFLSSRSVFSYTETSKHLILKFKHADTISAAPLYGKWMSRILPAVENPLCIPVPLHWTRLFHRTYNQAALLAKYLAKIKRWEYAPTFLERKRRTPSQGYLSLTERRKNVQGAFRISPKKKQILKGRTVLLIDDVYTTGATLKTCSNVLLKNGAQEVHALTLARVARAQS